MVQIANTLEGGTDGTAISSGNSGGTSGTAFDGVSASGSGATAVYDDDGFTATGDMSALMSTGSSSSGTSYLLWTSQWSGLSSSDEVWTRAYYEVSALPDGNMTIAHLRESNGSTIGCDLQLMPDGKLRLRAPTTQRYVSTLEIEPSEPFRLEWHMVSHASNGHFELRIFVGGNVHGTTPDETIGNMSDNWDTGDGQVGGAAFGILSSPSAALDMWVDDAAVSDVAWLGPTGTPPDPPSKIDTPSNFTFARVPGERKIVASWSSVENADDGYRLEWATLEDEGNPEDEGDWTPETPALTSETSVELDDGDGIDWGRSYRGRVLALTAEDN